MRIRQWLADERQTVRSIMASVGFFLFRDGGGAFSAYLVRSFFSARCAKYQFYLARLWVIGA